MHSYSLGYFLAEDAAFAAPLRFNGMPSSSSYLGGAFLLRTGRFEGAAATCSAIAAAGRFLPAAAASPPPPAAADAASVAARVES